MGMNDMIRFVRQLSGKLGSNIYAGVQPQSNPQHLSFLRQLQKEMKETNNLDCSFDELQVVVFDIETTGFHPEKGDSVLSIGAIKMIGSEINERETFYSLIKSDRSPSPEISELTKIYHSDLQSAPEASEVLLEFFNFIGNTILIAHHAKHEQIFMKKVTWDVLRSRFEHRIVDTSFLIRISNPLFQPLPLEEICTMCGIEVNNRHHALADAKMAAKLWSHFLKKAQDMGYKNLREVYEYLARLK